MFLPSAPHASRRAVGSQSVIMASRGRQGALPDGRGSFGCRRSHMPPRLALRACPAALPCLSSAARSAPPQKGRHALLVAVTYYENLPESKHLKGPANDAELMFKLLVGKLGFGPDQIVVLSEKAGKEKGRDFLP